MTEILRWVTRNLNLHPGKWRDGPVGTWVAIMSGFHFALRIGDIEKLENRYISVEVAGGRTCLAVGIRGSKTDQRRTGDTRALSDTRCDLRQVANVENG